jgi:PAS domain S-box-containing protein
MKKILVVDDEYSIRSAVRMSLRRQEFIILEAATGEEGLQLARIELPDLVLSDVNMSGMDGFELLRNLRCHAETSTIPVILMTGLPERADIRFSMEQGADDYLSKPFASKTLVAAVEARLERQQKIHALAKANESRLLQLLSITQDLIAIINPATGNFLYLNAAGRRMLAIGAEENVSKWQLNNFVSSTASPSLPEKLRRATQDGIWTGESMVINRDGRRVPVSEHILAHRPSDGQAACLFLLARDISDRQRAEAELEKTHMELLAASRQAGMAEIATGVLHNVGNVLNSVNVASACVARGLRNSKAAALSNVVALLQEHAADLGEFLTHDPKGKQITGYLAQLSKRLVQEQEEALNELAQLQKNIEHIRDIVTIQQNSSKVSGVVERLKVADLVEDVLRMNANTFFSHDIKVIKEFDTDLDITVTKHKALQILVNLVSNAKHACQGSDATEKKITIVACRRDNGVNIAVSDNGVGIPPENLNRIFTHGFTTKKDGHGFGLNSAAMAAKEMGGALSVRSDGAGRGATFTLQLPLNQDRANERV